MVESTTARPHVAWFVGDGAGARARLSAVQRHLSGTTLSALTIGPAPDLERHGVPVVELPWSVTAEVGHRAGPVSATPSASHLRRWLGQVRPDVLVVDGAPNLFGITIPLVRIRRPGMIAEHAGPVVGELAPYPAVLEPDLTPRWVRERTVHTGLLSRFSGRRPHRAAGRRALGLARVGPVVTVIGGGDGLSGAGELAAAASATPGWTWLTVGRCGTPAAGLPSNLRRLGWTEDPWHALEAADVVVAGPSLAVVAEVATARRPLVIVPPRDGRFADEVLVRTLLDVDAVTHLSRWPEAAQWPGLLAAARSSDPAALGRLEDGRGPTRAADWVTTWARSARRAATPVELGGVTARGGRDDGIVDLTHEPVPSSSAW
ncbi:MAG: hypothetical protein WEB09_04690 [Nitriliruptor sp.]